ncbi:MAG: hypothetical protein ACNI25_12425 [Halarcobacter sp.]
MKYLRGFRKNYFSLSAITAFSTAKKLQDKLLHFKKSNFFSFSYDSKEEESPPDDELLLQTSCLTLSNKPCHCDCVFRLKTKLAIVNFKFIPRCPFYTTYFAFRRTGVHPPFNLSQNHINK